MSAWSQAPALDVRSQWPGPHKPRAGEYPVTLHKGMGKSSRYRVNSRPAWDTRGPVTKEGSVGEFCLGEEQARNTYISFPEAVLEKPLTFIKHF